MAVVDETTSLESGLPLQEKVNRYKRCEYDRDLCIRIGNTVVGVIIGLAVIYIIVGMSIVFATI